MRLVNYRDGSGERGGLLVGDQVIDLQGGLAALGVTAEPGIRAFLGRDDWRELGARLATAGLDGDLARPRAGLDIGPIVPDPRKIMFVGANTHSHLAEAAPFTKAAGPLRPMVSSKTSNAITGPYDPIVRPRGTASMDYEAELCVVIGTRARRVPEGRAGEIIAGYTVANDISDRQYQLSSWEDNSFYRTHFLGKSFDGFCPCGPELVTPDEIDDLSQLRVTCTVNGDVKQNERLTDLYFSVEQVIAHLTVGMTLEPGDLILMGAPAFVAHFQSPPPYLQPGDVVRCEVESIGYVENRIVEDE